MVSLLHKNFKKSSQFGYGLFKISLQFWCIIMPSGGDTPKHRPETKAFLSFLFLSPFLFTQNQVQAPMPRKSSRIAKRRGTPKGSRPADIRTGFGFSFEF